MTPCGMMSEPMVDIRKKTFVDAWKEIDPLVTYPAKLIEAGVKVTINTDNMMFSRTDMHYEHAMLKSIGVSEEQLKQCTLNAVDAAFCDETTKEMLRAKLALLWG